MKKSSLRTVKEKNRRLILRALLTEDGLSRIELAKKTGLSPSTITALGVVPLEGVIAVCGEVCRDVDGKRIHVFVLLFVCCSPSKVPHR